jgi:hypothetical protein
MLRVILRVCDSLILPNCAAENKIACGQKIVNLQNKVTNSELSEGSVHRFEYIGSSLPSVFQNDELREHVAALEFVPHSNVLHPHAQFFPDRSDQI